MSLTLLRQLRSLAYNVTGELELTLERFEMARVVQAWAMAIVFQSAAWQIVERERWHGRQD